MSITGRYSKATIEANAAANDLQRAMVRFGKAWDELIACCADANQRLGSLVELITDEASHE